MQRKYNLGPVFLAARVFFIKRPPKLPLASFLSPFDVVLDSVVSRTLGAGRSSLRLRYGADTVRLRPDTVALRLRCGADTIIFPPCGALVFSPFVAFGTHRAHSRTLGSGRSSAIFYFYIF